MSEPVQAIVDVEDAGAPLHWGKARQGSQHSPRVGPRLPTGPWCRCLCGACSCTGGPARRPCV